MPETIYDWLEAAAQERHIHATFHRTLARQESGWYHVPVHISDALDAYDKASILQDMEDSWNDQEPAPDYPILLVPSAN